MKTTSLLFPGSVMLALVLPASAENLTDNDYDDRNPIIEGDLIVWEALIPDASVQPVEEGGDPPEEAGPDVELMVQYRDQRRRLTDNDGDDINPKISGTQVVWQSWDGNDWEIWAYDAEADALTQLTDNETDDINPCISNGMVVWQTMDDDGDYEIAKTTIMHLVPVEADLRITPRALNLRSRGRWINATLTGLDPSTDLEPGTILLLDSIEPSSIRPTYGGGLRMTFDRGEVAAALAGNSGDTEVTLTAETTEGALVTASDVIKVIP